MRRLNKWCVLLGGSACLSLTVDEQFSHISLWCLWAAPIIIGAPIDKLDAFTMSLLTNDELLDVDQDPFGIQAKDIDVAGGEVLVKKLADGTVAVGLFNTGEAPATVTVSWSDAGVSGKQRVRDLWRQKDLGVFDGTRRPPPRRRHGAPVP